MRLNLAKLPYVLLAFVVCGSMLFYLASAAAIVDNLMHYGKRARPPFNFSDDPHFLAKPLPEARRVGIQPKDEVLSVEGVAFTGMAGLIRQSYLAHPGQVFTVVYRDEEGKTLSARVPLRPRVPSPPKLSNWVLDGVLLLLFPAFCLGLGYWVVLAKPRDWNAWFFLGIMNVVPAFVGRVGYYPGFLTPFTMFWQTFAEQWMFVSLILLGIYFPVRSRLDCRLPWVKWLLIVPQMLIVPYTICLDYGLLYHVRFIRPYLAAVDPLNFLGNLFAAISLFVFIAAVVRKLFTVPAADARRRLGVVAAGSLVGLGPVLVILVLSTVTGMPLNVVAPPWVLFTSIVLFTFFPLSLAYTVIVQRALDVRIFLRQGTRYAFARGTLWALQFAVFFYLGLRLFHFIREPGDRVIHLIAPVVFAVFVLFLRLRIAKPLSLWVDRRFFREAYSAEQILSDLSEQARGFTETEPLLHTIIERVGETLHVEGISVLLRSGQTFRLQHAHGLPDTVDVSLPENSSIIRALTRSRGLAVVYREHPDSWRFRASPAELSVLNELHAELLLPLPGRAGLVGLMALGPKLSEEPYSRSDRQLLQSVALQTGLAIENNALVHHLAEEAALRKRMDREIEIAREVQERLFPQAYPTVYGLDFAGFCRTAQEVGGDYYDFIALENGRLGIAVGDVSGKGISAALLMASIRAALRGLTLSGSLDLARLMQRMNQIIYDSSTSNRFVTFFFGEYDPTTRTFEYVNAGHNAPILLREPNSASECRAGARCLVQRLDIGGPVIGILPEVQYEQGRLQLLSHDVLIAFTDGISEAMNADFEEWGEDRLVEEAMKWTERPAREIVSCVIDGADTFTAGAPQNDDLTMVVFKVA